MTHSRDEIHNLLSRCLSVDLEVSVRDRRIRSLAGVRRDSGVSLTFPGRRETLQQGLERLDVLAEGADFVLGHNLTKFDLDHLQAAAPELKLLRFLAVDTLWLNPLAFPRNPYHHLVKHYQDGQLKRGRLNDPELDARLTLELFGDQLNALSEVPEDLLRAWHWLTSQAGSYGFDLVFRSIRGSDRPAKTSAMSAIENRLSGSACRTAIASVIENVEAGGWPLAYALAWLSVAGGNSVMPPWVRFQFPEAGRLVRRLRDTACVDPDCGWCRVRHDAKKELAPVVQVRQLPARACGRGRAADAAVGG